MVMGDVAHLGERSVRIAEVRGSSPLVSTKPFTIHDSRFGAHGGAFVVSGENADSPGWTCRSLPVAVRIGDPAQRGRLADGVVGGNSVNLGAWIVRAVMGR